MTRRATMLFAAAGSLALLAGAFAFQMLGYAPCEICIWQRWPHGVAVAAGMVALIAGPAMLLGLLGALSALVTAGIGIYHTGIERGFWDGPASCTGNGDGLAGLSGNELLSLDVPSGIVMCDEVAWAFAGLSMASWNAILSLGLACIWIRAIRTA